MRVAIRKKRLHAAAAAPSLQDLEEAIAALNPQYSKKDDYALLLNRCAEARALQQGKRVHSQIASSCLNTNTFLSNHLVKMYGLCGDVESAEAVFRSIAQKNIFSWNIMVAAFAQTGHYSRAITLYHQILLEGSCRPDNVTFVNALVACCSSPNLESSILENACESGYIADVVVGTSMVSVLGRFGHIDRARAVFDSMPAKNVVSWTAMIRAYAEQNRSREAMEVFRSMAMQKGVQPDRVAFISVLEACRRSDLADGIQIHSQILSRGLDSDPSVMNAVLTMFARCGSLANARAVFESQVVKNSSDGVCWAAMIAAYAQHGEIDRALELLPVMILNGLSCDAVTFINVLFACSHSGRLGDACRCFVSMVEDHGVDPAADHYICILDLLGRVGHLDLAEDLIRNMPFQPQGSVWRSLLSACGTHGDYERGVRVAGFVAEEDEQQELKRSQFSVVGADDRSRCPEWALHG